MKSIQFVQVSPEEFQESILKGVRDQLEQLKKEYQPKEPEIYLTRAEVAQMLKVDLSTVHNWSKAGKIKKHGIGNRVLYKRSEIEECLIPLD